MKQPLSATNPFLKDPKERAYWIRLTVLSSARVEGIRIPKSLSEPKTEKERDT